MDEKRVIFPLEHQLDAADRLKNGNVLCGGVGTGKSFTALLYFSLYVCGQVQWAMADDGICFGPMLSPRDLYIITTARKRDTKEWEMECDRFDLSDVDIAIDSWNNIGKYENVEDAFFIFDEQRVVGKGKWVKSFYEIARKNQWILLSATPGDTWTDYIPLFVANGFYANRYQFLRRHAIFSPYVTKYPKITGWREPGYLEKLRRSITVVMKYERPRVERIWRDIWIEYDRELYSKVFDDRWDPWKEQPIQDISGACYLMRRVVNDNERKIQAIREIAEEHPRAIIFYNYDYELERLRCLSDEFEVAEWNGHVHQRLPGGKRWLYFVQYTAGSEGWNCVETDTIVFYSQSYSYKQMTQAAGRTDRMNSPYRELYYYILKSKAPIDMAISKALHGKKNFNEKLFMKW